MADLQGGSKRISSDSEVGTSGVFATTGTTGARAFWVEHPGRGAIRVERLAAPTADQVLIETRFSGISRGTETLVFRGEVPDSQIELMRCPFQAGAFPGPVKYGYMAVGRVIDGDPALLGQDVFSLHPHQDRFVVPSAMAVPLPKNLPPGRAVLAANMETALNVLWDSDIRAGDRVAVIGLGVVGLLTAWLAHALPGTEVLALDTDPDKGAMAEALDLAFASAPPSAGNFDRIIHASGHPSGLVTALSLAAFEARITEASWFGSRPVTLPLGEDFHSKRLTLASSQVGAVAPSQRAGWTHRRRLEKALELLRDPVLDVLIDGESAFEDLPATLSALADGRLRAHCHRVRYS